MCQPTKRFLVIRLSSIGDIVHALPAVTALGESFPGAEICWAVETRHAGLLEGNPFVHRIVKFDTLSWRRKLPSAATFGAAKKSLSALRNSTFDAAIDFQGLYKSALIAWLSRSRQRIGFSKPWLREPGVSFFYTELVAPRDRKHVIEMNLALVERAGVPASAIARQWKFPLPQNELADRYAEKQLAAADAADFIIVNAGGGWEGKRWAPENYAVLIRRLQSELSHKVILTGSAQEEELIRTILKLAEPTKACYVPSTLIQFIALARRARLFVGGDTGPMHLAEAVGTPVVAIFSGTDSRNTPERNGPFSADDIVLTGCAGRNNARRDKEGCFLSGVSLDSVLSAVHQRLARVHE